MGWYIIFVYIGENLHCVIHIVMFRRLKLKNCGIMYNSKCIFGFLLDAFEVLS
jgi:hypothetical protein